MVDGTIDTVIDLAKIGNSRAIKKVQNIVMQTATNYIRTAEEFYGQDFDIPLFNFDQKGRCGGMYTYTPWNQCHTIKFHQGILNDNFFEYLSDVVPHEIAHYIAHKVYKSIGHDKAWKIVMESVFKVKAKRCHNFDVSQYKRKVKVKRWLYKCGCSNNEHIKLSTIKHNKVMRRGVIYKCSECNQRIAYTGKFETITK